MAFIGKQPGKAAITSTDITDGIITADKLASNAVTTAKINADAVTDAKIADDVVGTEHLTAGEVDTTALGADAVTAAKIADNAISEEHLDATVVTGLTALAAEPADTDEFLVSDAGTLKRIDYSYIKGGGKVLQVVSGVDGTTRSTTSTSFVTASNTCTCAITPSATSSKVLLMFNSDIYLADADGAITIYRDSTNLGHSQYGFDYLHSSASIRQSTIIHLDSPNTTSQVTYQIYIRKVSGSGSSIIGNNTDISSLQAIEIGA